MNETTPRVVQPGGRIGMVGGGQLGRMFAIAAANMGYVVRVFCGNANDPAAQVAAECVVGALDDPQCVEEFAADCDVITLEFENIPAATMQACNQHAPTYPSASVLRTAQDRLIEKSTLRDAGLAVTPFAAVHSVDDVASFAKQHGFPVIVKTTRDGYDGKGQFRIQSIADCDGIDWQAPDASSGPAWIAEKCIPFDREVSVVVARTPEGQTAAFPPFENDHANHILDVSRCPAALCADVLARVQQLGIGVAETVDLVGVVCVELFVCGNELMINEIAPRPHNSGHLTIEACATSQFEQHVRAICNLPLGDTAMICGGAAMANLLGDLWHEATPPPWSSALATSGVRLHLYGKAVAKPGRKMGHVTCVSDQPSEAARKVCVARDSLRGD